MRRIRTSSSSDRNLFGNIHRSYRMKLLRLKLAKYSVNLLLAAIAVGILGSVISFFWYSRDLPSPDKVKRREGFSIIILDRNSKPVYDIYSQKNRTPVALSDIPDSLKKATVAIEDKDFYKHQGFDPKGILRATFNIVTFHGIQGGSTLTQQLVKNVLLTSEQSLPRKIKEFLLAVQIERRYKKDEILQMYLNEAPFGGTMWGIEAAAKGYFGKHAKDLSFVETVVLAGMPQRPSYYSPFGNYPTAYIKRSEEVLRRMREDGYITQAQELEYKKELSKIQFSSGTGNLVAPHFVALIKKQLIDMFGEKSVDAGGYTVTTTLDLELQKKSETILKEEIDKLSGLNVANGAIFALDPKTGEILSYVGSKDYDSEDPKVQGKFDVVSLGLRQPGSALKPITYAAAFLNNWTPSSLVMDVETKFPGGEGNKDYTPKNYDGKFKGPIQIRYALGNSINIPAVKMTALVGVKNILDLAYNMGLRTLEPTDENIKKLGLSITLGGGEVTLYDLVTAYSVFATQGTRNEPYSIMKVTDVNGKTVYEKKNIPGKKVLDSNVSYLISDILADNDARKDVFGPNSYLVIPGKTVSVKTGTTDDKRDNWTVGYTPSAVIGVWVGNNDNSAMNPKLASGITGAAPIWNRVIKEFLKNKSDEKYDMPESVTKVKIDSYGGGLPHEGKPEREEYFIKGTEPTEVSQIYKKIKLSKKDNNKLANRVETATGNYDEKEYLVFEETDPTAGKDGKNQWQEGINEWLKNQSDQLFHPPTDTSTENENTVVVTIRSPGNKNKIDDGSVEIRAEARAIRDIAKMEIYANGQLEKSVNNNSLSERIDLSPGIYSIKVKAYDSDKNTGESEVVIGMKVSPDQPSATPQPPATKTPSPTS